ncbi:hypothetical protein KKH3_12980 [Pectobacterium actinidiae]|nr:hypothetical protein KKH3_12980 [Pectobacterium actinidiae]
MKNHVLRDLRITSLFIITSDMDMHFSHDKDHNYITIRRKKM